MIKNAFFDLDNTLIDSEKIKGYFYQVAIDHGYTIEDAKLIYSNAREEDKNKIAITFDRYVEFLEKKAISENKKIDFSKVEYYRKKMMTDKSILFKGALELVNYCKENRMDCYLLSLGVTGWQQVKVEMTGLDKIFEKEKIIYTEIIGEGKIAVLKKTFGENFEGEDSILFNDKPEETAEILQIFPMLRAGVVKVNGDYLHERYGEDKYNDLLKKFSDRIFCSCNLEEIKNYLQEVYV